MDSNIGYAWEITPCTGQKGWEARMRNGVIDRGALLERVGGSRELLEEVTGMYTDERPALLDQLHAAIEAGDTNAVHRKAHRLGGTFGSLAAENATAIAARIVDFARNGDLAGARKEFEHLVAEARRVEEELRGIDAQGWGEPTVAR